MGVGDMMGGWSSPNAGDRHGSGSTISNGSSSKSDNGSGGDSNNQNKPTVYTHATAQEAGVSGTPY